ncbi:MAG: hypothetical protein ACJ74O_06075 [Frankiaceae bacterium]
MTKELPSVWRERRDDLYLALAECLLKAVGMGFHAAFDATFGATRFQPEGYPVGHERRASLVDVVDEIPLIAVQAFTGFSSSPDPEQRLDAASALPKLAKRFPEDAKQLLTRLLTDEHDLVRTAAECAREALEQNQVSPRSEN